MEILWNDITNNNWIIVIELRFCLLSIIKICCHPVYQHVVKSYKAKFIFFKSEENEDELNSQCEMKILQIMLIVTSNTLDSCCLSDDLAMAMIENPTENVKLLKNEVH